MKTGDVPSGAHGATNKEPHVCARRRVGEAAGVPVEDFVEPRTSLADFINSLLRPGPVNFAHMLYPAHRANNPSDIVRDRNHPQLCTVAVGCSAKFLYNLSQL